MIITSLRYFKQIYTCISIETCIGLVCYSIEINTFVVKQSFSMSHAYFKLTCFMPCHCHSCHVTVIMLTFLVTRGIIHYVARHHKTSANYIFTEIIFVQFQLVHLILVLLIFEGCSSIHVEALVIESLFSGLVWSRCLIYLLRLVY